LVSVKTGDFEVWKKIVDMAGCRKMLSGPPDSAGQKWDVAARGHRQASDSSRGVFIIALERGFLVNAFGSWEAEKIFCLLEGA